MKVFTFDFVPYGKDLTGRLKYPVGRENYESEVAARTYENHVEQFQLMEEVGFDGVCLNEHHGSPYSLDNSPNVFLAYVAAKTKRIKLAMAGNLLPLHGHPLRVAEELAMLDNLTRGRIIAGFVRGIPREYLGSKHSFKERAGLDLKRLSTSSSRHGPMTCSTMTASSIIIRMSTCGRGPIRIPIRRSGWALSARSRHATSPSGRA